MSMSSSMLSCLEEPLSPTAWSIYIWCWLPTGAELCLGMGGSSKPDVGGPPCWLSGVDRAAGWLAVLLPVSSRRKAALFAASFSRLLCLASSSRFMDWCRKDARASPTGEPSLVLNSMPPPTGTSPGTSRWDMPLPTVRSPTGSAFVGVVYAAPAPGRPDYRSCEGPSSCLAALCAAAAVPTLGRGVSCGGFGVSPPIAATYEPDMVEAGGSTARCPDLIRRGGAADALPPSTATD